MTFLSIYVWRIREFAFPELSSILPPHGYFGCEYLEVLFLVEPIFREVGPALFELLHTHNLRYPFPNDWNGLSVEIHECKCGEYPLYILASRFQISLLRVDDLFVVQVPTSQFLPDQRT